MEFEVLAHVSETGIRAYGKNIEESFENAAKAMFSIITEPGKVDPDQEVKINISAKNNSELLVDWLNELLFYFDSKGFLFSEFDLHIKDGELVGIASGEIYEAPKHPLKTQIKATTYYNLEVEEGNGQSRVQVYFDV